MPFERKTYDGDSSRGSVILTERRDSVDNESKTNKHAASADTKKNFRRVNNISVDYSEDADKDRYLITYADFITLLLGLFIILYSISKVDKQKYDDLIYAMSDVFGHKTDSTLTVSQISNKFSTLNPVNTTRQQINDLIEEFHYDHSIRLEENERGLTIRILEDILFASGKSKLNPDSKEVLGKLADIIKALPNDIRVEGHTDNVPISTNEYPSNWHLSVNRALNTAYFLIEEKNISADKVSIVGYSEYKPIAPNTSDDGRALNRRVDLVIIK